MQLKHEISAMIDREKHSQFGIMLRNDKQRIRRPEPERFFRDRGVKKYETVVCWLNHESLSVTIGFAALLPNKGGQKKLCIC